MLVFESCHSTWIFDAERTRFRRILKDIGPAAQPVSTEWCPYFGLETDPDGESFTVLLNGDGTRLLRSWRHTTDCLQCGANVTAQISLAELSAALGR